MTTSSFTHQDKPLPFVPVPWRAVPALIAGNHRSAYETMLEDRVAVSAAAIAVERINGPVYLLSASKDEMWPSAQMSTQMMKRLKDHDFRFHHQHDVIVGGHAEPLGHFAQIGDFLGRYFLSGSATACTRQ